MISGIFKYQNQYFSMKDFSDTAIESHSGVSKINAAGLINLTLENLWNEAFKVQGKNDLWAWNRKLDSLWLILGGDEDENSKRVEEFNKIEESIGKTGSLSHKKVGFDAFNPDQLKVMSIQYQRLMKKSLFLRRLQNKQGKGTAYADPYDDEFD